MFCRSGSKHSEEAGLQGARNYSSANSKAETMSSVAVNRRAEPAAARSLVWTKRRFYFVFLTLFCSPELLALGGFTPSAPGSGSIKFVAELRIG
jgi:hypothetical protein